MEALARRDHEITKPKCESRFKLPTTHIEDVACLRKRNLEYSRVAHLSSCKQIDACKVVFVIPNTRCGENFLEQVLESAARRKLFTVRRPRLANMTDDLNRH